jgi:signal transduction histidine kinase
VRSRLRVLLVEDSADDAELLVHELARSTYQPEWHRVETEDDYLAHLDPELDIVLADYSLPQFSAVRALELLQERRLDVPFIVVSGTIGEELATATIKRGAADYLLKDRLGRLTQAVEGAIAGRQLRHEARLARSRLFVAREEERQRIAADIHDDSIQMMIAVGHRIDGLRQSLAEPGQVAAIEELICTVDQAISRLRHLTFELRLGTLEREGLRAALHTYLKETMVETTTDYHLDDRLSTDPPGQVATTVYRIIQEALANVRKHSKARRVNLLLQEQNGGILLSVADNGIGLTPGDTDLPVGAEFHIGFTLMRERAEAAGGWCRQASQPGAGTTLKAWIPFSAH